MLILLPIEYNRKSINITFQVIHNDEMITIKPYNNINNPTNLYKIVLNSKINGINVIPVFFPLIFTIINNMLVCDLFFLINTLSDSNDFFTLLLNCIQLNINKNYIFFNDRNINIIINTIKLNQTIDNTEYSSVDSLMNRLYYRTNRYLNFCLAIISSSDNYSISSQNSKILQIINMIKMIRINFYGNEMSISDHIEHINNRSLIKKNYCYFLSNNDKLLKIQVSDIKKNMISLNGKNINISDYVIKPYPPKFDKYITKIRLIENLIIYKYNDMVDIVINIIYKKHSEYIKIIQYFYNNNIDNMSVLKDIKTSVKVFEDKYNIYLNNIPIDISFMKFKELVDMHNTFDIDVLKNLFTNYTHILNYDKRIFHPTFAKILYYSFKYYDNILENDNNNIKNYYINNKIKSVYIFLLKIYKSIHNNDKSILNHTRLYNDSMISIIIKILLFNDTYNLFFNISNKLPLFINIFIENCIIIQILTNITWKNISKQITLIKYLISMKNHNSGLFIIDGKLNKYIINPTMDTRLKKIIIDPLLMYSYLKREVDYYKWTISFKDVIRKIFYNPIILKDNDYIKLSKIIFLISKITIQSMDNNEYIKLIKYLQKNVHIILFNDRINIKIKDIFKNNNLNFGFLAKHINDTIENTSITITDDIVLSGDTVDTNMEISKITRKYYKYKGRYLKMKYDEIIK